MKKFNLVLGIVLCLTLAMFGIPSPVQASATATVSIEAPATVAPGEDFTARINITQVDRFSAGNFDVVFDHSVLEISDITPGVGVTDGELDGSTIPVVATNWVDDNLRVVLHVSGTQGVSGPGYLCQLHFHVIGSDGSSSDIEFINGVLSHFVDHTVEKLLVSWPPPFTVSVAAEDTTPPTITTTSPTTEETNVAIGSDISVTFSEPMDQSSAESAFSISPTVSGSFSWGANTMTFDPNANLAYSTEYTVTIAGTATDLVGNGLDGDNDGTAEGSPTDDYTWSFTTKETPTAPEIGFSPETFTFSGTEGGDNPADQTLEVWNSGTGTLDWSLSDDAAWLTLSPTTGSSTGLSNVTDVTVSVDITDMAADDYSTTITIEATGVTSETVPVSLHISAAPEPNISVSPTSKDFGNVTVGSSSSPQTFTVSNAGTATLTITDITISGPSSEEFSMSPYPETIPAGDSAGVNVTFSPTSIGSKSATLVVTSNDPDEATVTVSLSGNGVEAGPPPVGGTVYPGNNVVLLGLWIGLGLAIIAGAIIFLRRRHIWS